MTKLENTLRERYLYILKNSILNSFYAENILQLFYLLDCVGGRSTFNPNVFLNMRHLKNGGFEEYRECRRKGVPFRNKLPLFTHSMIGNLRMDNIQYCAERIFESGVKGDFVETGVWQGGACIFMRGLQVAYEQKKRNIWVCDSFEGLPVPEYKQDESFDLNKKKQPMLAVSQEVVEDNFRSYDLLDNNVKFLKGWFKDTLPNAPIKKIALLRLDGDLYASTMDALNALYHKVEPGGFIIIDDYIAFPPCKQAVDEFRETHNITETMHEVDWTAVYWQKA